MTSDASRSRTAAGKAAAEPAMSHQADMTHSDSMDIVTPKNLDEYLAQWKQWEKG